MDNSLKINLMYNGMGFMGRCFTRIHNVVGYL